MPMAAAVWTEARAGCESVRITVEIESACVVKEGDGMVARRSLLLDGLRQDKRITMVSKSCRGGGGVIRLSGPVPGTACILKYAEISFVVMRSHSLLRSA